MKGAASRPICFSCCFRALLPNEKDSTGKKDAQDSEKADNPEDGKHDKPQT